LTRSTGCEAARLIRALRLRDLMIVALTGWGQPMDLEMSTRLASTTICSSRCNFPR